MHRLYIFHLSWSFFLLSAHLIPSHNSKLSLTSTSSISISKIIYIRIKSFIISLMAQHIKNPPAIKETRVWNLDQEDPLKDMATHSSILAWKIPCTEEPGGLPSKGSQRVGHSWMTKHTRGTSHFYSWFKTQPTATSSISISKIIHIRIDSFIIISLVNFFSIFPTFISFGQVYLSISPLLAHFTVSMLMVHSKIPLTQ